MAEPFSEMQIILFLIRLLIHDTTGSPERPRSPQTPMQKRLWTSLSLIATHAKISHLVASLPTLENHGNSGKCLEKSRIFGQIYQKICQRAQSHMTSTTKPDQTM